MRATGSGAHDDAMLAMLLLALASAPQEAPSKEAPRRILNLEVFGDDPCPKGDDNEIIVCARLPEGERYRMPKRFREAAPAATGQAWTNQVATMDEAGREAGGLPNTCSPVGAGGQTGCTQQLLRQWSEERRAAGGTPQR